MQKKTLDNIKKYLSYTIISILVGAGIFVFGTFKPNFWIFEKIEKRYEIAYEEKLVAFEEDYLKKLQNIGFTEPAFVYNDKQTFIKTMYKCIDYANFSLEKEKRVPSSILVAMAMVESANGTSRFANEGNNLFGIRTWDDNVPQMKPRGIPNAKFGVKKFPSKCSSVVEVIRILNNHPAYEEFRKARNAEKDYRIMLDGISAWSTNEKYSAIIYQTIVDNKLP